MAVKLAFIGASGMLGKPVARQLLLNGFEVYALARDPEKMTNELPGVYWIKGDLKNAADVETLLSGKEILYMNLSIKQTEKKTGWHTESDGMKIILESAKKNKIQRIVYLSSIIMDYQGKNGFNWWVFEIKHNAVNMIKECGIPFTIFYPSNFMESISNLYKMGNKMMLAGKSLAPMYFISAYDYGKQVSRSLLQNNTGNKEYYIQGPEAFTADNAIAEFMKYYTKEKLTLTRAPLGMLRFFGWFNTKMNYGAHILEALNNYPETFKAQPAWDDLGKPETTVKKYAESFK